MGATAFQRAVDAAFIHHGVDGVLDPDGVARDVKLLPFLADDIERVGSLMTQHETDQYEIRAAEFEGFGKQTILAVGSDRFVVQDVRTEDARRFKRVLDLVPADA
ncbi:MAG: hypothetical protein AAGL89_15690 [Pseudomonadota bacterium]